MAESVSNETRERITLAAMEAVRRAPVRVLSIKEVADAAGVTSSSIYKAYSNKYELFAEASRRILVEQVVVIADGVDDSAPPAERLRQTIAGLARVGRNDPFPAAYLWGLYPMIHHRDVDDAVQEKIAHVDAEVRARFRHRIVEALEAGELAGDVDELVELCTVAAFGYLGSAAVSPAGLADPDAFAEFVIRGFGSA